MNRTLVALALLLVGCGGGSSPSAPTPPTTTMPSVSSSRLTLGIDGTPTFTITSTQRIAGKTLKCGDYDAVWVVSESAGLRAQLTFTDVFIREADGDIQDRIAADRTADNTFVEAGGQLRLSTTRFECGYTGQDLPMVMSGTFDFRDARGNTHHLTGESGFTER